MNSVVDGWREARNPSAIGAESELSIADCAEIRELLVGQRNVQGTGWERPPLALRLWLDGTLIRFCFSSKEFDMCLWGSCQGLELGLLDVEQALCKGHCDWRPNKQSNNGFTQHRR